MCSDFVVELQHVNDEVTYLTVSFKSILVLKIRLNGRNIRVACYFLCSGTLRWRRVKLLAGARLFAGLAVVKTLNYS